MKYVIIGSSAAGVAAAHAIRQRDPAGTVTLVTRDRSFYSRCQLHLVASGARRVDETLLAPEGWSGKLGIGMLGRTTVVGMDPAARTVRTEEGVVLPYDRLLIATGSRTAWPPVEGLQGARTLGLRDLEDAEQVHRLLPEVESVAIIGAGLVGVELAAELARAGKRVSLIEVAGRPLPLQLEEVTGGLCAELLRRQGVALHLGDSAVRVTRDAAGMPLAVHLKSGASVPAGLIVVAAGVKPNVEFAQGTGLRLNRGVLIDAHCRTSLPDVFAAGDVTETEDAMLRKVMPSAIWPTAVRQGKVAGSAMSGGDDTLTRNTGLKAAVNILGTHAISLGPVFATEPAWRKQVIRTTNSRGQAAVKILYTDAHRLHAALLWGDVTNAGLYHEAIVNRRDIGADAAFLASLDAAKRGTEKLSVL